MPAVGMLVLGAFIGFVSIFALMKVEDWSNPLATLGGTISSVLAVSVFTIFEIAVTPIGDAIYFYPIGLGFGALCAGMRWIGHLPGGRPTLLAWLHMGASALAGVLILVLVFSPGLRASLPAPNAAVATVPREPPADLAAAEAAAAPPAPAPAPASPTPPAPQPR